VRAFDQNLLMNEHPAACVGVCDTPDLGGGARHESAEYTLWGGWGAAALLLQLL